MAIEFAKKIMTAIPDDAISLDHKIRALWYHIEGSCDEGYVVYSLHGGAYVMGSAQMEMPLHSVWARSTKCTYFAINYRLAPRYHFPCALIDAISGYMHLLDKGIKSERIVIYGNSAGAGLTIALLMVARELGLPMPAGAYLMSAWVDLTHSHESFAKNKKTDYLPEGTPKHYGYDTDDSQFYAPNSELRNQYVSPIFASSFKGLPPVLIQTGTAEQLFDENVALAEKLARESGSFVNLETFQNQVHIFQLFDFLPCYKTSNITATEFIKAVTGRSSTNTKKSIRSDFGQDGKLIESKSL